MSWKSFDDRRRAELKRLCVRVELTRVGRIDDFKNLRQLEQEQAFYGSKLHVRFPQVRIVEGS